MNDLIPWQKLKPILEDIAEQAVQLQSDHINEQKEVSGKSFAPLKASTIKAKERKGGGVAGNKSLRMKATDDFVHNAFQYSIDGKGVTIFISDKPHKQLRTKARQQTRVTNKKKGWNVSPKPPKQSSFSYQDLASWQLSGKHDQGKRKAGNPGADFFGLSKNDERILHNIFVEKAKPIIEKNIKDKIFSMVKKYAK
jgi:hypothetical protein